MAFPVLGPLARGGNQVVGPPVYPPPEPFMGGPSALQRLERDVLSRAGHHVEVAETGGEGVRRALGTSFDLILCDWEMPEMSGLELLQWFRGQPGSEKTPFIMVTSRGDKENVIEAIQAGVSDFIGKPFTNDQLNAKVKKALHRSGKLELLMGRQAPVSTGMAHDTVSHLTGGKPSSPVTSPAPKPPAVMHTMYTGRK